MIFKAEKAKTSLNSNIVFKDSINELFIGSDYTKSNGAYALIDNLRISDIYRPLFKPFGEAIDVDYSTNINVVFPVTKDLYTTLLMDFNTLIQKITSFATLKNRTTGLADISITIYDNFGIVSGSAAVKNVLETLLNTLKPASSRLFITYVE